MNQQTIPDNNLPVYLQKYKVHISDGKDNESKAGSVKYTTVGAIPSNVKNERIWNFDLSGTLKPNIDKYHIVYDFKDVDYKDKNIIFKNIVSGTFNICDQVFDASKIIGSNYTFSDKDSTLTIIIGITKFGFRLKKETLFNYQLNINDDTSSRLFTIPIGCIIANIDPDLDLEKYSDWKDMNGQLLEKNTYPELSQLTDNIWFEDENNIKLPDLQGRTIFAISASDPNKNIDPISEKATLVLNNRFGKLMPRDHTHDILTGNDSCDNNKCFVLNDLNEASQSGKAENHLNNVTDLRQTTITGQLNAENSYPPHLGVRWLIKAKQTENNIPKNTILISTDIKQGENIQDLTGYGDELFLFQQCSNFVQVFQGSESITSANISIGKKGGGTKEPLAHSHSYTTFKSDKNDCCFLGKGKQIAISSRVDPTTSNTGEDANTTSPYDFFPPFQKFYGYIATNDITDNVDSLLFFYPNQNIPFNYIEVSFSNKVFTPLLTSNISEAPLSGGILQLPEHNHQATNLILGGDITTATSGGTRQRPYKLSNILTTGNVTNFANNPLDIYPPATAYYAIKKSSD